MGTQESQLVEAFRNEHPINGIYIENVLVGQSICGGVNKLGLLRERLTQKGLNMLAKRIDLTIENDKEFWIVEAKYKLDPKALGQVLMYKALLELEKRIPAKKKIKLAVIFTIPDELIKRALEYYEIEYFQVLS